MREAYLILVPGTSETHDASHPLQPTGMTKLISTALGHHLATKPEWAVTRWSVPYTSGYGDKASYVSSVHKGVTNLRKMLRAIPADVPVFIVGYSQGATIAGDVFMEWVLDGHADPEIDNNLVAYYGISDPRRNHGEIVGTDPGGQGITGERGDWRWARNRVYQFCAPGDIIASSDPGLDLFQEISVFTNRFWVGDVLGWIGYSLSVLGSASFQQKIRDEYGYKGLGGYLRFRSKLRRTIDRGVKYITSNVHTSYGKYKVDGVTVPEWIANDIARKLSALEPKEL
ncbi:lysin B [Gordonia phage Boneham]|uniref:Lysin B n=1 Tax=Gordonia phage Boneham TaxID=2079414 RepID=A0A2L1IWJ0_9CAUD|nr:lysin B [Gordonia phage Boneham]